VFGELPHLVVAASVALARVGVAAVVLRFAVVCVECLWIWVRLAHHWKMPEWHSMAPLMLLMMVMVMVKVKEMVKEAVLCVLWMWMWWLLVEWWI
jgi:hypothetical protein